MGLQRLRHWLGVVHNWQQEAFKYGRWQGVREGTQSVSSKAQGL